MRTIAVLNQKGGVGKTTTVANVAGALAAAGRKVIAIDLDPQAHLTIHLGVEPQTIAAGVYEVLTQSANFEASLLLARPNLWLLGANINLVGAETELVNVVGREIILREAMQASQEKFDLCLIDCPPSLSVLSLNALAAAQEVLIPLQPHFLALQGFGKLLQTVDLVNRRINPHLKVTGVLLCMHDTRASLSNEVRADIDRFLQSARGSNNAWSGAEILPTYIRRNIKLAEAPSYGQTIFEYDPDCNGTEDYGKVAKYLLGVEDIPAPQPAGVPATSPVVAAADDPTPEVTVDAPSTAQGDDPVETPPATEPTSAPADALTAAPATDAVSEVQENNPLESRMMEAVSETQEDSPLEIPLADASPELPPDGSAESSLAPEPPTTADNDVVERPLAGPAEVPTTDTASVVQEDNPLYTPPAGASAELPSDSPAESSLAAEPPTIPDDNVLHMPAADPAEVPATDAAPETQEDNPLETRPPDASPELSPDGSAGPSAAPEPPKATYDNRMEAPLAALEKDESPAPAAPVDAPPEPQADGPAQSTPAVPPIPIVTANPLVPRCYNPVPIWPAPATSSSANPNRQVAFPGKRRRHGTRPILLLSSWIRWILSYSNPLRVIRPSAAPLLSPAED